MVHLTLLSRTLRGLDQSLINGPPDTFVSYIASSLINGPPDTFVSYIHFVQSLINGPPDTFVSYIASLRSVAD